MEVRILSESQIKLFIMENKSLFESKYFHIGQHSWVTILPTIIWFDIKQPVFAFEFLFWSITFDFYNKNED